MTKNLATYLLSSKGRDFLSIQENSYRSKFLYDTVKNSSENSAFKNSSTSKIELFQKFAKKGSIRKSTLNKQIILKEPEQKQSLAMMLNFKKLYRVRFKKRLPRLSYRNLKKKFGVKSYNSAKFKISDKIENLFQFNLTILIKKNNVFCTFSDFKEKKTIKACSSGTYKIKVSKKTLRYTYDLVLEKFYRDIRKQIYQKKKKNLLVSKKGLFVTLVCSKRLRKKVSKSIRHNFKKIPLLIKALNKKIFNGCRPPKKVRKKRRSMRIYK